MFLSIVSTETPATVTPVAKPPAKLFEEPVAPLKKESSAEETQSPKAHASLRKTRIDENVGATDASEDNRGKHKTKPPVDGMAMGAADNRGDFPTGSTKDMTALGGQEGRDVVVYARPRYKQNPLPHYPKVARRRAYEGQTLLRVQVLRTGKVGQIEVEISSGFELLDEAALRSVKEWTFVPGTKNGVSVDQWVMIPVRFSLK
jgi:protein TonB